MKAATKKTKQTSRTTKKTTAKKTTAKKTTAKKATVKKATAKKATAKKATVKKTTVKKTTAKPITSLNTSQPQSFKSEGRGSSICCHNCEEVNISRQRDFSEQAWTLLVLWEEISPTAVYQPLCEVCYQEMREVLIERNHEIESSMAKKDEVQKIMKKIARVAS